MFLHKLNILLLGFIALTWSSFGNGAPSVSSRRSYKELICGQYLCNKAVRKESKSIARTKICDGVRDCALGDDELDCPCKPLPAPDNGRVSYTGNQRYTHTAHFTCDRRFELIGDSSRTCQPPGIWSRYNPSCKATECPPLPEDGHGRFKIHPPFQNAIGAVASLECDPGYVVDAEVMTVCLSKGSWSPTAESSCQLSDCGHPELVPNGGYTIIKGQGYDGSIAELICDSGFKIASGLCIIVACENGAWTAPSESCQAVCPHVPNVDHGTVQYSGLNPSDSLMPGAASASLVCDAGYEPSAAAILNVNCVGNSQTASWDGNLGPCAQIPDCGEPTLDPHGDYTYIHGDGLDGSIAVLTCNSGFEITSGLCISVACENGAWTSPGGYCEAVCQLLPAVTNGIVHYSGLNPSGSLLPGVATATLVCNVGYKLSAGAFVIVNCVGNYTSANWDDSLGTCVPIVCKNDWMIFENSCYFLGKAIPSMKLAETYCNTLEPGARLVFVETMAENDFLKDKIMSIGVTTANYWIGMTDSLNEGTWRRSPINSPVATYFNWADLQPNNAGFFKEDCAIFSQPDNYEWNDVFCIKSNTRVLCEL